MTLYSTCIFDTHYFISFVISIVGTIIANSFIFVSFCFAFICDIVLFCFAKWVWQYLKPMCWALKPICVGKSETMFTWSSEWRWTRHLLVSVLWVYEHVSGVWDCVLIMITSVCFLLVDYRRRILCFVLCFVLVHIRI